LIECDLTALQDSETWKQLAVLVYVKPDVVIFPVRARYAQDGIPTIGLNYLSSDHACWFTLADCVASKLLTGKTGKLQRSNVLFGLHRAGFKKVLEHDSESAWLIRRVSGVVKVA
jgi:hypothetical protein